jgi:hypothetical protein
VTKPDPEGSFFNRCQGVNFQPVLTPSRSWWAGNISVLSGIGAIGASLPLWLAFVVSVSRGPGLGDSLPFFDLMPGLFISSSVLGLAALVFGVMATGNPLKSIQKRGRFGIRLGLAGAVPPWTMGSILMAWMFVDIFGGQ